MGRSRRRNGRIERGEGRGDKGGGGEGWKGSGGAGALAGGGREGWGWDEGSLFGLVLVFQGGNENDGMKQI